MKAMLLRDAMSPLVAAGWWVVDLELGVVSPVRLDSSTERSLAWGRRGESELHLRQRHLCGLQVVFNRGIRTNTPGTETLSYLKQTQVCRDPLPHRQADGVSWNQLPGQQVHLVSVPDAEGTGGFTFTLQNW